MATEQDKEAQSIKIKKKPSLKGSSKKTEVFKVDLKKEKEETPTNEVETVKEKKENLIKEVEVSEEVDTNIDNHEVEKDYPIGTKHLPENVDKLVTFMNETGGTIEDYLRLNVDYSAIEGETLLKQYYQTQKPHLSSEEINFLVEDKFDIEEDIDDEREVKMKKLAQKEEIEKAKTFFNDLKEQYYADIKLRSTSVNPDQQKALDFFNRYNKEQDMANKRHESFIAKTKEYLNKDFEGFNFEVSGKHFKYGVSNPDKVAENQSNLNTFVRKFLDSEGNVQDHEGYHKALYSARNADVIAEHFYEQGKADAIKDLAAQSNNVSNEERKTPSGDIYINGLKVRAINGVDSSKLKIKRKTN